MDFGVGDSRVCLDPKLMRVSCVHARVIHKKLCRLAGSQACLLTRVLIVQISARETMFSYPLNGVAGYLCVSLCLFLCRGVGWEASSALGKVGWVYWGRKCWSVTQSSAFIKPASKICLCRILSAQCLSDARSLRGERLVCRTGKTEVKAPTKLEKVEGVLFYECLSISSCISDAVFISYSDISKNVFSG